MHMICETVEIVCDNEWGYKVINKDDLKKDDVLWPVEKKPAKRNKSPKIND